MKDAKKAALKYREMEVIHSLEDKEKMLSLIDIELLTGRHHQIRVQFAGHGTPLYGDGRYGGDISTIVDIKKEPAAVRRPLALCAYHLAFLHPVTGEKLVFEIRPSGRAFNWFSVIG